MKNLENCCLRERYLSPLVDHTWLSDKAMIEDILLHSTPRHTHKKRQNTNPVNWEEAERTEINQLINQSSFSLMRKRKTDEMKSPK